MKKEDIEFLKELQHELNTQETDGQAAPRFWGIEEDHSVMTYEGEGDPCFVDEERSYTMEEFKELVEEVVEESRESVSEDSDVISEWNDIDKKDPQELLDFARTLGMTYVSLIWVCNEYRISQETGCFLTKRAAKRHLKANHYHYRNGHTYAMTAWRNPEFERVLNILQTMDLNDIKVTE